jgi:tRNA dimethylallyltransferase
VTSSNSAGQQKLLVVIAGPTAVGKTPLCVELAQEFQTEIVSSDSRQFFEEMQIGTAVPAKAELAAVKHHFIQHLSIQDAYDVSSFETDALQLLNDLFRKHAAVFLTGGSGLYINAVCQGFDELPDPDPVLRKELEATLQTQGLIALQRQLKDFDPVFYEVVDKNNPKRLIRALEVCLITRQPYSQLRKGKKKNRPFRVLKIVLNRSRKELFTRIAERTDRMLEMGLLDEVVGLLAFRHLNALKTVGYRELYEYLDGNCTLTRAIENIKTNTRRYAKRQLTWFKKDEEYHWFHPDQKKEISDLIKLNLYCSSQIASPSGSVSSR